MIEKVVREYDDYNVLINNAGFGKFGPLAELASDDLFTRLAGERSRGDDGCARVGEDRGFVTESTILATNPR
jgi:hypothetical protein